MENKKLGFIGCGKMAQAIVSGILSSNFVISSNIFFSEKSEDTLKFVQERYGINYLDSLEELVKSSDIIFLCTKPFVASDVLTELSKFITEGKKVISIMAGITTSDIEDKLGKTISVIRVIPNTPVMIKEGMSGISKGNFATDEDLSFALDLFSKIGESVEVPEDLMGITTAVSSSSPAFFYYLINAMAKAGEEKGLDFKTSLKLAAQTAIGSAKMLLTSSDSPEVLIRNVTTPGGCTEVGINVLNKFNVDKVLEEVIFSTADKAQNMVSKEVKNAN